MISSTLKEKITDAELRASYWRGMALEAEEKGNKTRAEKLFAKSKFWLDRSNKLRGNAQ